MLTVNYSNILLCVVCRQGVTVHSDTTYVLRAAWTS